MLHGCRICSSTALIRRAAVPPGAFLQEDFPPFDFACWLRMADDWDFAFVPRELCHYRLHAQSHSSGVASLDGASYVQGPAMLAAVHAVKLATRRSSRPLPGAAAPTTCSPACAARRYRSAGSG